MLIISYKEVDLSGALNEEFAVFGRGIEPNF
jgi:hypothetical protein